MNKVIDIEGLIGVGKSTLCNKIKNMKVLKEETNEKFLQLFYDDPKKYGFAFQYGMFKQRVYQSKLMKNGGIWDRGMAGDYIFCLTNHIQNNIDEKEFDAYMNEVDFDVLKSPDMFIWLNDTPENCKNRTLLRGNLSEKNIPLSYYNLLYQVHFYVLLFQLKVNPVIVNFNSDVDEYINGKTQHHIKFCSSDSVKKGLILNEESIDEIYNGEKINERYKKIYIPLNIMNHTEKDIKLYDIKYISVVLELISNNIKVVFIR